MYEKRLRSFRPCENWLCFAWKEAICRACSTVVERVLRQIGRDRRFEQKARPKGLPQGTLEASRGHRMLKTRAGMPGRRPRGPRNPEGGWCAEHTLLRLSEISKSIVLGIRGIVLVWWVLYCEGGWMSI